MDMGFSPTWIRRVSPLLHKTTNHWCGVRIIRREHQNCGGAGARRHYGGAWLSPKNKPPPQMCYHVKFGSYPTKGAMYAQIEWKPKMGGVLGYAPLRWGRG